ncbi:unnamed protein product [Acanthocheilonema viteae]|uniref:Methyltransferase type 11 domain-containing protein n=1 Tax=Acanthocheilonema viteae TaxID=6277 RepID=A0A498SL63_ACAVI|nr:unnamed protein product [Acanthocheilonema viteae]
MDIEKKYVQEAYRYLASFSNAACCRNETRKSVVRWIVAYSVIALSSFIAEVVNKNEYLSCEQVEGMLELRHFNFHWLLSCGEAKYHRSDCFFMDCDTCLEMLVQLQSPPMVDLQLADVLNLPYRSNSIDAVLLVSVLHHFTTLDRRKRVLTEVARCLRPRQWPSTDICLGIRTTQRKISVTGRTGALPVASLR